MKKTRKLIALICSICILATMVCPTYAEPTKSRTETYQVCDANLDGSINTGDAVWVLRHISFPTEVTLLGNWHFDVVNANHDHAINTGDAVYILRYIAGINVSDPEFIDVLYITVSFVSENAEETVPESYEVLAGEAFTIPDAAMSENFIGWKMEGDETLYQAGATLLAPEDDVVFTAQYREIPDEIVVQLSYKDDFNVLAMDGITNSISLNETTTLTSENIPLPEGYMLMNADYSVTITFENGIANPASVVIPVKPYMIENETTYILVKTKAGFENIELDMTANYMLANDLDMQGAYLESLGQTGIGEEDVHFEGIFDGDNHKIHNFVIDEAVAGTANTGLFAYNDGTIANLNVVTVPFTNDPTYYGVFGIKNVGIVCGYNAGLITNCHAEGNAGSLDASDTQMGGCGGIAGLNSETGTIVSSSFIGGLEGFYWIGGITGKNFGTIEECYFIGDINEATDDNYLYQYAIRYIGGIFGGNQNGTVRNCYMYITTYFAAYSALGGIGGWCSGGVLENLYISGPGTLYSADSSTTGLLVGHVTSNVPTVINCYNLAAGTSSLPEGFDSNIWTLQGSACNSELPDLLSNRRPSYATTF